MEIRYEDYGKIAWLWAQSPMHIDWSTHLQTRFIEPAILSGQYHILEDADIPVAYCSWAFLSKTVANELAYKPGSLNPSLWNSGDDLWFIDWVSPFASQYTWKLRSVLKKKFVGQLARSVRVRMDGRNMRIAAYTGKGVSRKEADIRRSDFNKQFFNYLMAHEGNGRDFTVRTRN